MAESKTFGENLGGSAFWTIIILAGLTGMVYLAIWSFQNSSVKGIALSSLFSIMILAGIVFSRFEIFKLGGWGESCLSFLLGFVMWLIIGGAQQNSVLSVLSVSANGLFASISSELPRLTEFLMTGIAIPIAEESLWLIGIPFALIMIMNAFEKSVPVMGNKWFQLFVITIISGATFALFHVGKWFFAFLVAAFIFRAIMIISVIGESSFDIIPGIHLVPAFSVGAHIGNNIANFGIGEGFKLLTDNFLTIGWFVLLLFVVIILSGLNTAGHLLKRDGKA